MKQTFLNTPEDCQWLRDTHLHDRKWNNANSIPDFKSFCLFGNEDAPTKALLYRFEHPQIEDRPVEAIFLENGTVSFFRLPFAIKRDLTPA